MMKILKITKTAWIGFLIAFFSMFFMVSLTHAQGAPDEAAKKYNVSFPVAELGGCENYAACRNFCEDPVNSTACIAFAKQKGFYKEDPISTKRDQIIAAAKLQLGCDSEASCKALCELGENKDKCATFAQSQNLPGGYTQDPKNAQIIQKAQTVLGCNSETSCKAICAIEVNREKCSNFAKEAGLRGGEERKGPGGCNSQETCSAFCSDPLNFNECSKFGPPSSGPGSAQAGFKGPGGCNSEQSCRSYCEQNPAQCKIISIGAAGFIDDPKKAEQEYQRYCQSNPSQCQGKDKSIFSDPNARVEFERFCSVNPDKCATKTHFKAEAGNSKAKYEQYCAQNPGSCETGPGGYSIPKRTGEYVSPGDYCRTNPELCPKHNPQEMCQRSTSCKWVNNSCQCEFNPQSSGAPNQGTNPSQPCPNVICSGGLSPDPAKSCACTRPPYPGGNPAGGYSGSSTDPAVGCRNAGGNWTGSYCQMPNTNTYQQPNQPPSGMTRESQEAGCRACNGTCNWNGDFCGCQCGNTTSSGGSTTSTPPPTQQTSQSTPTPEQTQPAPPPPDQPASQSTPPPTVQGVSTVRGFFDRVLDIFR